MLEPTLCDPDQDALLLITMLYKMSDLQLKDVHTTPFQNTDEGVTAFPHLAHFMSSAQGKGARS